MDKQTLLQVNMKPEELACTFFHIIGCFVNESLFFLNDLLPPSQAPEGFDRLERQPV